MDYTEKELMETCVESELIYDGQVVHLYVDRVKLPDGKQGIREYVKHIGAVAVLPLTDDEEVICVRQYRYAHGVVMLEIPAGKLDSADEDRLLAAKRELREETGFEAANWLHLCVASVLTKYSIQTLLLT